MRNLRKEVPIILIYLLLVMDFFLTNFKTVFLNSFKYYYNFRGLNFWLLMTRIRISICYFFTVRFSSRGTNRYTNLYVYHLLCYVHRLEYYSNTHCVDYREFRSVYAVGMRQHDDNKHAKELSSAYLIERKGWEKKPLSQRGRSMQMIGITATKKLKESKRGGGARDPSWWIINVLCIIVCSPTEKKCIRKFCILKKNLHGTIRGTFTEWLLSYKTIEAFFISNILFAPFPMARTAVSPIADNPKHI